MHIKQFCIIVILLFYSTELVSQVSHTEICVDFRVNSGTIDPSYSDNAARMQEIIHVLHDIRRDSTISIVEVSFCGAASPEGSDQLNRQLARKRLASLEEVICREVEIPDSIITHNDSYIPWDYLKSQIKFSEFSYKEEIIAILEEEASLVDYHQPGMHVDNRIVKLKRLDNGAVWEQMNKLFFERMRNACAVFITYKEIIEPEHEPDIPTDTISVAIEPIVEIMETKTDTVVAETVMPEDDVFIPKLYLKTNVLGLGMAIINTAAEVDLANHWSFTLPVYYSAWDYFKSTIKFRTFAIQPEFRYWFSENNDKFFLGAHFGIAHYNFAFDGDYRCQDHEGKTPAIGGGLSVGYRLPISENNRWRVEISIGAGFYPLHYDKFRNTEDVKNGLLVNTIKKNYWGLDQAAVSFSYSFNLKKKGGK